MTIQEALLSINVFPVTINFVLKVCIDRGLTAADDYSLVIGATQSFELATADIWAWLSKHPNIVEQEVGVNNAVEIKKDMLAKANQIYAKYDDPAFNAFTYGFVGENFNG